MAYVTRFSHFTFSKEADELVITSERNEFETRYEWPEDLSMTDEDLARELYDRFYISAVESYNRKI